MKSLIILCAALLSFSSMAELSGLDMTGASDYETITGKINAGYINAMEEEIKRSQAALDHAIANLDEPVSKDEGKILAVMIETIELELSQLEILKNKISGDYEIVDEDVKPFDEKVLVIKKLIAELAA